MLKKIILGLVLFVAVVLVLAALQPDNFRVERSVRIAAPVSAAFAQVNDLHRWQEFSPWAKLDPNAKLTFEGPATGTGAAFAWAGNSQIGEGKMTITESKADELVRFRLDFVKPFASTSMADFTFKQDGSQTVVTWSMYGKNMFLGKVMCLFVSMDKMVGGDFEQGLASLKAIAEASAKK